MSVSIVIPNYNGMAYLKECLGALEKQTFKDFEIIIVDNASTDDSVRWIEAYYPDIHIVQNLENRGFSAAVNAGISLSNREFVVLLNTDTVAHADWLFNLFECISKEKGVFSCSSKMLQYRRPNLLDDAGDEYTILGWAFQFGNGLPHNFYNRPREILSSCAGAAIYRKAVFSDIGLFNEEFFAYLEDVDIGVRAFRMGYKNLYCPKAVILHYGSATSGGGYSEFKVRLSARNNIWMIKNNFHYLLIAINIIPMLFGWTLMWMIMNQKGFSQAFINGTKEGLFRKSKSDSIKWNKFSLVLQFRLISNTYSLIKQKLLHRRLFTIKHKVSK